MQYTIQGGPHDGKKMDLPEDQHELRLEIVEQIKLSKEKLATMSRRERQEKETIRRTGQVARYVKRGDQFVYATMQVLTVGDPIGTPKRRGQGKPAAARSRRLRKEYRNMNRTGPISARKQRRKQQ